MNPTCFETIRKHAPDAVLVFGYKYATHLMLLVRNRSTRFPLIFRGDSHLLGRKKGLGLLKERLLRAVYAQFAALLYTGKANKAYFRHLGVAEERLFFAPHAIDLTRFDPDIAAHAQAARLARANLKIPADAPVVLFCGKFVPRKEPRLLLEAFLEANLPDTFLVFAGAGPEESALRERANGQHNVRFLPFSSQVEMPARYLMADLFVLPSRGAHESWGLAVQEALAMGVPCVTSDHVGCHPDLVDEGVTGWTFPAGNRSALIARIEEAVAAIRERPQTLRKAALEKTVSYTYTQTTEGLLAALRFACGPRHTK